MRTMRFLLLFCVLSVPGLAQATEYWVTSAGAGSTNGTSFANAFAGWADITGLVAGDTLHICGTITTSTELQWNTVGTAAAHIILTGVCAEGTPGILDGNALAAPVLNVRFSFVDVTSLTVRNSLNGATGHCLMFGSAGGGNGYNIARYNTISACGKEGILTQKPNSTIEYNTITNIGENGINLSTLAIGCIVQYNDVRNFSTLTTTGDGIEMGTTMDGDCVISHNYILFENYGSTKGGLKIGNAGTAGTLVTAEYNDVECKIRTDLFPTKESRINGAIFGQQGNLLLRNNTVHGCRNGISWFNDTANPFVTVFTVGNICRDIYICVRITSNVGTPTYHVLNNTGSDINYGLSDGHTASSITINHYNNIWNLTNQSTLTPKEYGMLIIATTTYNGNANLVYPEGTDFISNAVCGGTVYATMAAYKAACAQEAASMASDPLFMSATDSRTRSTSPVRNTGIVSSSCRDPRDRMCQDDRRNIGAYQASSGDQATTRAARQ